MSQDGLLDKHNRIPFAGIAAIVLLVAIVAVFMNIQLKDIFPEDNLEISSAAELKEQNVAGQASASYYGKRVVPLVKRTSLQGLLHMHNERLYFIVNAAGRTLQIADGFVTEEVVLEQSSKGGLTATFEFQGNKRRVDIFPERLLLEYSEPGESVQAVSVALTGLLTYEGFFEYNGAEHLFQFVPQTRAVRIQGPRLWDATVAGEEGVLKGTWAENGNTHPIQVNLPDRQAIIEDLW